MNAHWGYGSADVNYKSLPGLIETLCSCRKVGANYLLNVGPTGEGELPLMQEALLRGIGEWISNVGDSIYKGKPCGVLGENSSKNFALRIDNKLYFYVHDLSITGDSNVVVAGGGKGINTFSGVNEKIKSIKWTDNNESLEFTQDGEKVSINCTGYSYGKSLVVRIAEATLE
jgi:alpha-L-fucosidase